MEKNNVFFEKDEPGDLNRVRPTDACIIKLAIYIALFLFVLWGSIQIGTLIFQK